MDIQSKFKLVVMLIFFVLLFMVASIVFSNLMPLLGDTADDLGVTDYAPFVFSIPNWLIIVFLILIFGIIFAIIIILASGKRKESPPYNFNPGGGDYYPPQY